MTYHRSVQCNAPDPEQTDQLGQIVARQLSPGNLVLLNGTLGAGKSALARAIIRQLLNQPQLEVPSPTFLLVLPYENEETSILHADLYRLKHEEELDELGLFEDPDTITLIEWPERAPHLVRQADVIIDLSFISGQAGRLVQLSCQKTSKTFERLAEHPIFEDSFV